MQQQHRENGDARRKSTRALRSEMELNMPALWR